MQLRLWPFAAICSGGHLLNVVVQRSSFANKDFAEIISIRDIFSAINSAGLWEIQAIFKIQTLKNEDQRPGFHFEKRFPA